MSVQYNYNYLTFKNHFRWIPEFLNGTLEKIQKFVFASGSRSHVESGSGAADSDADADTADFTRKNCIYNFGSTTMENKCISDFPSAVTQTHIFPICGILENTPNLRNQWTVVIRQLFKTRERADVETPITPLVEWLHKTLEHWVTVNGSRATFDTFLGILKSRSLQTTAGIYNYTRCQFPLEEFEAFLILLYFFREPGKDPRGTEENVVNHDSFNYSE